ncbi:hypothetical protein OUQ49_01825 [Streptomyces cavourensis]|uniref:hypothetical protein n=1 Tax=Streptomyces cavourensis TaxID=67258 RepID=UPI0022790C5C|nr:hypothetical protein [Streptomyces cavourensis]WAE64565.1 hypothetical protein OUQ49_01825 [Streptomyces cavourensis]
MAHPRAGAGAGGTAAGPRLLPHRASAVHTDERLVRADHGASEPGHFRGGKISFDYPAKSRRRYCRGLVDEESFSVVRALLKRRGGTDRLIEYWEGRRWHQVEGSELNEHLHAVSGHPITTKDFRTWHATVLTAVALAVCVEASESSEAARKRPSSRGVREVANYLGNTPAVCRASYINPRLFELFDEG